MMKNTAFSAAQPRMGQLVCIVLQRNIIMVQVQTNAGGVVHYPMGQVVCTAQQKIMKNNIPLIPLKEIAEISQGICLKTETAKLLSREQLEECYGLKKYDVVIRRNMFSTGKKIAVVIKDSSVVIVPNSSSLIIRPDLDRLFPLYLKAFLEYLPSDKVIKDLSITNQKSLLSKGSLSKLLIPLPPLQEQIKMSSEYEKVKGVEIENRYRNPIIEQYDSLRRFFRESRF